MTVAELITLLQTFDPEMPVLVSRHFHGSDTYEDDPFIEVRDVDSAGYTSGPAIGAIRRAVLIS